MDKTDFYVRILYTVLFGIAFCYLMYYLGKKNCAENPLKKRHTLRIIGIIFITFGALLCILAGIGIGNLNDYSFPTTPLPQPITNHMIIRSSHQHLYHGYPTYMQSTIISCLNMAIIVIALGLYMFAFRRSETTMGRKTLKVVAYFVMFMVTTSAVDFHYYDIWEFIPLIIITAIAFIYCHNWQKPNDSSADYKMEIKSENVDLD